MNKGKRNVLILGVVVLGIIIISLILIFSNSKPQKKVEVNSEPKQEKVVKKKDINKKPSKNLLEEGHQQKKTNTPVTKKDESINNNDDSNKAYGWGNLYRSLINPIGTGDEMKDSNVVKANMLDYISSHNWKKFEDTGDGILQNNKLSKGTNLDIAGLMHDEGIYKDILANQSTISLKDAGQQVRGFQTPESLVLFGLYFENVARGQFIISPTSLSPMAFSDLRYIKTIKYSNEKELASATKYNGMNPAIIAWNVTGRGYVYAVRFSLNSQSGHVVYYDGIVGENRAGSLALFGYYCLDQYKKVCIDKPLDFYYSDDMREKYAAIEKRQEENALHGNLQNNQLYPWMEQGGKNPY